MARQRKSLEEQINALNKQITMVQDRLNSLLGQKESLLTKKREEEVGELYGLIKDRGLSVQDVYDFLSDDTDKEKRTA